MEDSNTHPKRKEEEEEGFFLIDFYRNFPIERTQIKLLKN
jgi:hypothetical protein